MTSSFLRFLDHTQRRITVGRTPLDEWSARRRDFYLTTHNTHNRQTFMPPVGFEPTISAGERPQTYAFDRADTGSGTNGTIRRPKFRMRVFRVAQKGISFTFKYASCKDRNLWEKNHSLKNCCREWSVSYGQCRRERWGKGAGKRYRGHTVLHMFLSYSEVSLSFEVCHSRCVYMN